MLLYLLRHADAALVAPSDAAREITQKGHRQARTVAAFCERHGITPDLVLTSPYARARQTAEIVARAPREAEWLASGMRPEDAMREIRAQAEAESIMLVGHEPDLSDLAAHLLGLPCGESFHLRKASLTALEMTPLGTTLEYSVPVRFMPAI